jgi:predicted membrane-bound dolichyl-phosphate-mannose-protein mannosyltransferase
MDVSVVQQAVCTLRAEQSVAGQVLQPGMRRQGQRGSNEDCNMTRPRLGQDEIQLDMFCDEVMRWRITDIIETATETIIATTPIDWPENTVLQTVPLCGTDRPPWE